MIHFYFVTCDGRLGIISFFRAIFLSGGVTLLPGFAERLEKELSKLAPPGVPVEVHS